MTQSRTAPARGRQGEFGGIGMAPLGLAFFLSGVAALVYQIVWQRMLHVAFGVDIESVTIVVSTFMLGLGVGAWWGGVLADRLMDRIPIAFCVMEGAIAVFGAVSVDLIETASGHTATLSRAGTAAISYLLLSLPTFLMGATLPMLVTYAYQRSRSVGVSTGTLYFLNTAGAAFGAAMTGFFLLHWFDAREVAWIAACANVAACAVILTAVRRR